MFSMIFGVVHLLKYFAPRQRVWCVCNECMLWDGILRVHSSQPHMTSILSHSRSHNFIPQSTSSGGQNKEENCVKSGGFLGALSLSFLSSGSETSNN